MLVYGQEVDMSTLFPVFNGKEVPLYTIGQEYTLGGPRSTNSVKVTLIKIDRENRTITMKYRLSEREETMDWGFWMDCVLPNYGLFVPETPA